MFGTYFLFFDSFPLHGSGCLRGLRENVLTGSALRDTSVLLCRLALLALVPSPLPPAAVAAAAPPP